MEYTRIGNKFCIQTSDKLNAKVVIDDLSQYMEPISIKPLLDGDIIKVGEKKFRTERIFDIINRELKIGCRQKRQLTEDDYICLGDKVHCYIFISADVGAIKPPFVKTPSYVMQALKENKIIKIS